MHLQLRRALSAAATSSAQFRRAISTGGGASRPPPPWAVIRHAPAYESPSPRASFLVADPPRSSHLLVPDSLIEERPAPEPGSDMVGYLNGVVSATSGDGLLLVSYMDTHAPASVVPKLIAGTIPKKPSDLDGLDVFDPDMTRFVCNPVSGELFRLPDIDGTKKTILYNSPGLLTRRSSAGQGPPDSYAVAFLREDRNRGGTFNMRRFLSRAGEWEKLEGLPSPILIPRRIKLYTEVVAFAGRLWWADLTWGLISADPFSDRPELSFVELPRGSVWAMPWSGLVQMQGVYRRVGVSEGKLCYVELSQKDPEFILSSFALDDDARSWTLEHRVALGRLSGVNLNGGSLKDAPRIGVIDPLNSSVICVIVDKHLLSVDMDMGKVLDFSPINEKNEAPAWGITSVVKACVLPPWLASAKIPTAGTYSSNKGNAETNTLSDILVRVDKDKN
uniref:DUF1618 domain-containing protein n=1 Tax=Leersia perrieri TaxID=77586 RepID=A0A0D9WEB7_9ORYZ